MSEIFIVGMYTEYRAKLNEATAVEVGVVFNVFKCLFICSSRSFLGAFFSVCF